MPTLLDEALVADALTALPGWTGDAHKIRRVIDLDSKRTELVMSDVAETAHTLDHHPVVEREGDKVALTLWTESMDGVTELDITMAARINDVMERLGSTDAGELRHAPMSGGEWSASKEGHARYRNRRNSGGEPFIGVPSMQGGSTPTPGTIPDDDPKRPQPGVTEPSGRQGKAPR